MPIVVPVLDVPATKVKVVPLTTSVSLVVMAVPRSLDEVLAVPDNSVAVVIAALNAWLLFQTFGGWLT